ncbi:MAG: GFA family protein [Planctomycetota bacterium]
MAIVGGCSCGAIRYCVSGELVDARSCHGSKCRKVFSGAASAYAEVGTSQFEWSSGQSLLTSHLNAQGWGVAFCSICGSTLCGLHDGKVHGVTLGTVDGDPGVTIQRHIFTGSKAPWDEIGGNAPQFHEHAP